MSLWAQHACFSSFNLTSIYRWHTRHWNKFEAQNLISVLSPSPPASGTLSCNYLALDSIVFSAQEEPHAFILNIGTKKRHVAKPARAPSQRTTPGYSIKAFIFFVEKKQRNRILRFRMQCKHLKSGIKVGTHTHTPHCSLCQDQCRHPIPSLVSALGAQLSG